MQLESDLVALIMTSDYLAEDVNDYTTSSVNYTIFLQSEYINLPRLKQYLGDLQHVGYELGLYGLYIATRNIRRILKASRALELITDSEGKTLYELSLIHI